MKPIDQITTKEELEKWIKEKKETLDRELIFKGEEYHQKLTDLEKKFTKKLRGILNE